MSPHDNWHFPIIMWKGGLEWKKSLKFNKILTTDYKSQFFWKCVQNLMVWRLFRDLYRFLKTSVIMWGHPHVGVRKIKTAFFTCIATADAALSTLSVDTCSKGFFFCSALCDSCLVSRLASVTLKSPAFELCISSMVSWQSWGVAGKLSRFWSYKI